MYSLPLQFSFLPLFSLSFFLFWFSFPLFQNGFGCTASDGPDALSAYDMECLHSDRSLLSITVAGTSYELFILPNINVTFKVVGVSTLAGLVVMIALIPLNSWLAKILGIRCADYYI